MKYRNHTYRKVLGYLSICAHIKPHSKVITHLWNVQQNFKGINPPES